MFCSAPFNKIICFNYSTIHHVEDIGLLISPCYGSWLKGNTKLPLIKSVKELRVYWQISSHLKTLRSSISDGSNFLCKTECCPMYINEYREPFYLDTPYPSTLIYSGSRTCNLKCITCRRDYITERYDRELFKLFLSFITPEVKKIKLNCSGEALINPGILEWMRGKLEFQLEEISLITNGLLLDHKMYNSFSSSIRKVLKTISVSVDAVTKETYEGIRRGGNFDILKENLEMISFIRRRGLITKFNLGFVISRTNVHELSDFCLWAKELKADGLNINMVDDWRRLSRVEYLSLKPDTIILKRELEKLKAFKAENLNMNVATNFKL
jgi:MoaA/NifB/PqqE/SkfB family radical SAM enzyme